MMLPPLMEMEMEMEMFIIIALYACKTVSCDWKYVELLHLQGLYFMQRFSKITLNRIELRLYVTKTLCEV